MQTPAVVVGTDGTEPGTAAVRWAATEAAYRRLPLRVVHVLDWDWSVSRYDYQGEYFDSARRLAERTVREAARRAKDLVPSLTVEFQVAVGRPVTSLARLSRSATLLAVGSRGEGGSAGWWLGSVSRRVVAHARCPVVVVRGRHAGPRDPVAVGVDDSGDAEPVLQVAFTTAHRHGVGVVAVRSYRPARLPAGDAGSPECDSVERDLLTARLVPWRARFPDVPVDTLVSTDSVAATLAEVSHGTRLVVLGNHAHGLFSAAFHGSDATRVLRRAHCPVLVVQEPRTRKDHHESTYR
ncbi:universal stress protein [Actinoplanes italicus]|uniref:Nucleotide-binding universal stress UspA family protein n=1 Tax=Actinoplanes italicus TaxID=113567 RepID=A0A2T0KEW8_9ACTN|nr:universal stress protein [Actinoplanes italicus]PRX21865.1 nucleotide-binding universal stress UspA family protein [Actinoplanes italicus]GIE29718.1 universal stress protein [Actinoplanes italicus]